MYYIIFSNNNCLNQEFKSHRLASSGASRVVKSSASCALQNVLGPTHSLRRRGLKILLAFPSSNLTQFTPGGMIVVEELDVDRNASPLLRLASIHHQEIESAAVSLGGFPHDFASAFGRHGVRPRADGT